MVKLAIFFNGKTSLSVFSIFLMWVSDEKAHIAASCFDPDILSSV